MLTVLDRQTTPNGVSRRHFLTAGAAGFGGLTLAGLLRAEARAPLRSLPRSIVHVHLDGGPPQMDLIDLKPDAPAEIRGEFRPIPTVVDGLEICELLPKIARIADRFAFIRSLVGAASVHDAFQCQSGFPASSLRSLGGRPALGSVLSKLEGSVSGGCPTFVDLLQGRALVRDSARPGFLGPTYKPFRPDISEWFERPLEPGMVKELAARGDRHSTSLVLDARLSDGRLGDRLELLGKLDRLQRRIDAAGEMQALDEFHQQAAGILTSGRFAEAMDLEREDPRCLERYTIPEPAVERFATADNAGATRKFLLARRLLEAGVRCVAISISDFDTHSKNFQRMRHVLPILDHGLSTFVLDLEEHGLLESTTIVVWGEFGRTPRINDKQGGRDHWPKVGMAMLAGGGLRTGQVIGATDRTAAVATERPIDYQDVFATLWHTLGIDARRQTIEDPSGRPQYLVEHGEAIPELV